MHPHVDSAHTHQDAPAESHTQAKQEGILQERAWQTKEHKKILEQCLKRRLWEIHENSDQSILEDLKFRSERTQMCPKTTMGGALKTHVATFF